MSTTTLLSTAVEYSGVKKQRGTVFEIQVGRIDVGASIVFLSQYPGEEEILFPPLGCLEVPPPQPTCTCRLLVRKTSQHSAAECRLDSRSFFHSGK